MPLPKLPLEAALKVPLYGGRRDPFAPAQPAAMDAVQVLAVNHFLKGFRGSLAGLDAGAPFAEVAPAGLALPFAGFQLQNTMPQAPVLVPDAPLVSSLVPQPLT